MIPSIEANFVLIGACIPTMYPLVKRIWGASALGGSTNRTPGGKGGTSSRSGPSGLHNGSSNAIVTIGSIPKKSRHGRGAVRSITGLDTFHDDSDSKYIILEERSFHTNEVHDPELASRTADKIRQTQVPGW